MSCENKKFKPQGVEIKDNQKVEKKYETLSGIPLEEVYTPEHIKDFNYSKDLGDPGEYPFTRSVHKNLYRGKVWTMRQFSGFGTAEETNQRYKYLLSQGQTGLSVAFDLPTLMGRDSDDPLSTGEIGKCGVAVSSLRDMEILFDGIPMENISTSMTINSPAAILWAMYIVAAEKQGAKRENLRGTIQNDILKEYIAQKEFIFPPKPSMRLVVDTIEFGTKELPLWNTISISGYHIREAGSTASQELAFTLADGFEYINATLERGLNIDDFAPRLSLFFNSHLDFFEEIAKMRAARRIWARTLKEKYGAKNPRSLLCRFHTQTAGCSLTAQQPYNNIIRTAYEALAAVFGGTQSLHTNSMDETWALPTEEAVTIALRTQQIIAEEIFPEFVIDPLGGSYFVEWLTNKIEEETYDYFRKIENYGGVIPAIERGFFQQEIARSAYEYQMKLERGQRNIVGITKYVKEGESLEIPILYIDESVAKQQISRLKEVRKNRDNVKVEITLKELEDACRGTENTMPYIINAVSEYATLGEIVNVMKKVFGEYQESTYF